MKFLIQTHHDDIEADDIFGIESAGAGWYDYEEFTSKVKAKKRSTKIS